MIKINLYGGPSSGKSTLAAQIFAELKVLNKRVELVREYAKELVYEGQNMKKLTEADRLIILAEQFRRESILLTSVDYIITDSPMILTAYFHRYEYAKDIVLRHLNPLELHIWVERPPIFEEVDRSHNEEESKQIDKEMLDFIETCNVAIHKVSGSPKERLDQVMVILRKNIQNF
jgi:nicotinamide riboside kinase